MNDARNELRRAISHLPRFPLAHLPTPLEEVPRFAAELGSVRILVKREDLTARAFGGNKTRELELFVGEALHRGADVFIAGGGAAQSNHAVQCSAAALRAGLLPAMVLQNFPSTRPGGNLLLDRLMQVDVRFIDCDSIDDAIYARETTLAAMDEVAEEYRSRGHVPYVLPSSFHPLAVVAYAECALELTLQLKRLDVVADRIYVTSAGATQAGLALGLAHLRSSCGVTGISHTRARPDLGARLASLADEAASLLGVETRLAADDFDNESFAGAGYGELTEAATEAITLLARTEGMFLDPVYTGKGMAGLISHVRSGRIAPGSTVVFVHTGGLPALFAYGAEMLAGMVEHV